MGFIRWLRGFPSNKFLREASKEVQAKPDLYRLEKRKTNFLFEYGELMSGMPKHLVSLKTKPITNAYSVENFSLWKYNNDINTFPIALKMAFEDPTIANDAHKVKIRGELYKLTVNDIILLDSYRAEGLKFIRKHVNVILPSVNPDGKPIRVGAWMYVGNNNYWKQPIDWDVSFYHKAINPQTQFGIVKSYEDVRPFIGKYNHFTPFEFDKQYEIFELLAKGRSK
jgi:gamma-glutamylcyclotransferase (GGCT)/AIG2-like uncharacterized protein YtfP